MAGVDRTTGGRDIIWQPVFCTLRPRYLLLPYSVIFFGRGGRTGDLHTSARCAHALIRHQRVDHCIVANLRTRRDMIEKLTWTRKMLNSIGMVPLTLRLMTVLWKEFMENLINLDSWRTELTTLYKTFKNMNVEGQES